MDQRHTHPGYNICLFRHTYTVLLAITFCSPRMVICSLGNDSINANIQKIEGVPNILIRKIYTFFDRDIFRLLTEMTVKRTGRDTMYIHYIA